MFCKEKPPKFRTTAAKKFKPYSTKQNIKMSDGKIPMLESAIMETAGKSVFNNAIFLPIRPSL